MVKVQNITSQAFAKISMRLVPNQDWEQIELFTKHFVSIAPAGVTVKVKPHHGGQGYVTPIDSIGYKQQIWHTLKPLVCLQSPFAWRKYSNCSAIRKELKAKPS
jgi:hypothetical protein